jgi:hypothetical protein
MDGERRVPRSSPHWTNDRPANPAVAFRSVDADLETVHWWAETVLLEQAFIEGSTDDGTGRRSDPYRATLDRCAPRVLRALDADLERLRAVRAASWSYGRRLLTVQGPGSATDICDLAAALTWRAENIIRDAGLPDDAGPAAREAVMAEADLWLEGVPGQGRLRRARWRRRYALVLDVVRR